jgi:LPS O-antigen subunit length determinant protein (WzzB/FepE family)
MGATSTVIVSLLMLIAGIFLSYMLVQKEEDTIVINQPIFAQLGIPSDSVLLNKTNMTTLIAPTITENTTTITPAPEVNETLIGRSTPTTSNTTLQIVNKTGEAEPLGGIK